MKVLGDGTGLDQACVVNAGAKITYNMAAPLIECVGDLDVTGTVTAAAFDPMYASSAIVTGDITTPLLLTASFSQDYYVSKDGDDISGNGTATNPYKTISGALSAAGALPNVNPVGIYVAPGTYEENINMNTCANIISQSGVREDVVINGNIALFIYRAYPDASKNVASLQSLTINGTINLASVGFPNISYTFLIDNCVVTAPINGTGVPVFRQLVNFVLPNSVQTYITNSTIQNMDDVIEDFATAPIMFIGSGQLVLHNCNVLLSAVTFSTIVRLIYYSNGDSFVHINNCRLSIIIFEITVGNVSAFILDAIGNVPNILKISNSALTINSYTDSIFNPTAALRSSYIPFHCANCTFNVIDKPSTYAVLCFGGSITMVGNVYVPGSQTTILGTVNTLTTF